MKGLGAGYNTGPALCQPRDASGGALEKRFYIPRAELATRNISTVFRASGLCLAFSFLLVASTWGQDRWSDNWQDKHNRGETCEQRSELVHWLPF